MGFESLVKSRAGQKIFIKIRGWGMAILIIGGLFKINYYPFASELIIVGGFTLAIYYFFSAYFEPKLEPDWTLVYPELGGAPKDYRSPVDVTAISDLKKEIEKLKNEIEKLKADRQV